jgi:hypothetical protein
MADETLDPILEKVDPEKREFLKKVIVGTAFVAPIVSSFSLEGLSPNEAFAQSPNASSTATTAVTTPS